MASGSKYPDELRERAVAMVFELRKENGQRSGALRRVAEQLGINPETLRNWTRQAEVDDGQRAGTTTVEHERVRALEREVKELRRANEILKAASSYFAKELDPKLPR